MDQLELYPEYSRQEAEPYKRILIHFANHKDLDAFGERIGARVTPTTRVIWYPNTSRYEVGPSPYVKRKPIQEKDIFGNYVEQWRNEWQEMPEFEHEDLTPWKTITVYLESSEAVARFSEVVEQTVTPKSVSLWYPEAEIGHYIDKRYSNLNNNTSPRYPIYVISKNRWESRKTVKGLEYIGVPYWLVIEPQEYDQYAAVVDPSRILTLPFSDLGQGSIPARNWVFNDAVSRGYQRHWILDDNIGQNVIGLSFYRFNHNLKIPVSDGTIFRCAEDFTDRYTNVGMSGFNYFMFASRKEGFLNPYTLNTRIYSCILINHDIGHRWRGRYNEDTDLSLRVLKDGWCTILFNAFLADKTTTMTMKGGNSDELYAPDDGRLKMAQSLVEQHPDVASITWKWNRWQHHVDYSPFKSNQLKRRPGLKLEDKVNNYGMALKHI